MTPQSLAVKALTYLVAAIVLLAAGAYGGYRFELGSYQKEVTAYHDRVAAEAQALADAKDDATRRQHLIDDANQGDAIEEAYYQGELRAQTINLQSGVPSNVTIKQDQEAAASDHSGCVTFGFARMLYAGAHGVSPDSLSIPGGQSVDACTALEPSKLAAAVAQDLNAGVANTDQLTRLIAADTRNDALALDSKAPVAK